MSTPVRIERSPCPPGPACPGRPTTTDSRIHPESSPTRGQDHPGSASGPPTAPPPAPPSPPPAATPSRLTVSDGALSATDDVVVTVNPANTRPTAVNAGPDRTITLPAGTSLSGSANDDGLPDPPGILSYSWSGPSGVSFGSPTSATTSASFATAGSYTIRLTVSDGALSATDDVIITVNPANTRPTTVNAGSDRTITLPAGTTLSGSANDDGLPDPPGNLSYSWSGPSGVSFGTPTSATTSASFATAGSYTIRLTVSDGALSATDDVIITVNPANTRPTTVNAGSDRTITLPAGTTLSGSANDDGLPDPPGNLSYTWSGPSGVSFGSPTSATTSASFATAGSYTIRLTVSDGALSATDDVIITVNPANTRPTNVNAGSDRTITLPAGTTLSGSANDDGLPDPPGNLSYTWSGPSGVSFGSPTSATTSASFATAGSYTIRLTVSDGALSATDDVIITVKPVPNQPPTAVASGPATGTAGTSVAFSSAGSSDSDGTIASYAWTFGDGGTSTAANPSHIYATGGTKTVTLVVTDNDNAPSAPDSFSITINAPPVANAGGPYAGTVGYPISVSGSGSSDSDGSISSYAWAWGDGSTSAASSLDQAIHTYSTSGSFTVTLTVTDDKGASSSDSASVTVAANQAPTVAITAPPGGAEVKGPLTVRIQANDPETSSGSLTVAVCGSTDSDPGEPPPTTNSPNDTKSPSTRPRSPTGPIRSRPEPPIRTGTRPLRSP